MRKPILTIFFQFNPWNSSIGGVQTIIRSFIKYAPEEFEVRVAGTGSSDRDVLFQWREDEYAGRAIQFMPLFHLPDDNRRKRIPTTTLRYAAALLKRRLESDFMHFHRLEPTLATRRWQGEKTLFIHNDIKQQCLSNPTSKGITPWLHAPAAYSALEGSLVRQFNSILSCHTNSITLYRQRYPDIADRVAHIKNSYDSDVFSRSPHAVRQKQRRDLAQQLHLPESTKFILFAGRLHPQKDPLLLLQAIAALNDPNAHLLIAGDGELAADMQAEILRLGLGEQSATLPGRVTMLGPKSQVEMAHLLSVAHVFVLSSIFEGLPVVVLEALASGTPIVTTDCGDTPKLLTPYTGIVCQERTPLSLATALRYVLQHPEKFPSQACSQSVQSHAAHKIVADVYAEMFARWEGQWGSDRDLEILRCP